MINNVLKKPLPIVDYDQQCSLGNNIDNIPLCPHCKEWSYYTTESAEENNGVHICPFCDSIMYMPENNIDKHF